MACARALREHPGVNASYGDDCVIEHERVNIGLALALDDGLTVPVILDADVHTLEGLAAERLRLAEAARTRSCAPRRSSPARSASRTSGRSASTASSALVLPPQAAILAVGSLRDTVSLSALVRSPCRRRRTGGALPRDDRAPAGRARLGARGGLSVSR